MRTIKLASFLLMASVLWSQAPAPAPNVAAEDPADEIGKLKKNCPAHIIGCAEVLFTGQPLHITAGSIAPQNGVGFGLAYVGHKTTDNWRDSWSADAVASMNGSWRAGFYLKLVDSRQPDIGVSKGTRGANPNPTELPEQPLINIYVQATSLNKLTYFGLGPDTQEPSRSYYGMTQTIAGVSGVKPFNNRAHAGIYGEVNGRWVDLRVSINQPSPSIELLYTEATAPGLGRQIGFLQLGAGARMRPAFRDDLFHLNYDVAYRPYIAVSDTHYTFQRVTFDLSHEMLLYHKRYHQHPPPAASRESNGPNDCSLDPGAEHPVCPKASVRDLQGSIGFRFFTALSMVPGGNAVPFYLQPTIGGADINGAASLSSFQDYRFRAPNVMFLRESFEHSIWKLPVGFAAMADQGTVALTRGGLGSSQWRHSYAAGLTLRAGGFPMVYLLFSWGGGEGTHTIANLNTSLLGGAARPGLY